MKKTKVFGLSKTIFVSLFVLNFVFSPASFVFAEESVDSTRTEKVEVVKEEITKEEVEEVKETKEEVKTDDSEIKEESQDESVENTETEEVTSEEVNDDSVEVEATNTEESNDGEVAGASEDKEEESLVPGTNYITICHATASQSNPYLVIEVDPNGWNGHDGHAGDFIITDLNGDQVVDEDDCTYDPTPEPNVCIPGNLVSNGGFEYPVISGNWDTIPNGTAGLEWTVDWADNYPGAPLPANMEIQNSGLWTPYEGNQYIELDSDWGYNNQEEAGTRISQVLNTVPGVEYTIRFAFSARPGTNIDENGVQIILDDVDYGNPWFRDGSGKTDTDWTIVEVQFTAVKNTTVFALEYAYDDTNGWNGSPNTLGTLIDNVSVDCGDDTDPQDPTGSITVCKVIVNGGVPTDGSELPQATFSISGVSKPAHLGSSYNTAGIIGNTVFETPINLNESLFDQGKKDDDVECVKYNDLPYGNYFYGEEVVPAGWATPMYHDGYQGTVSNLNDFHYYSNELFTADLSDDVNRNQKSDGHITLSANNPNRFLVVKNEYIGGQSCDPLYARVKFAGGAYGSRNWGSGDMSKTTYVGSDSNSYGDGEWFMVHDGANFINDADIASYRDVPGIAVQRLNGSLRVVLNGFHDNSTETNKEAAQGYIELSRDMSTRLTNAWDKGNGFIDPIDNDSHTGTRLHDPEVNDSENPMDSRGNFVGYIHYNNPRFDNVSIDNDLFKFRLVVTTASDGFYADYTYDVDDCEPVDNPPVITVDPEVINVTVGTVVDILSGVTADDLEDGDITVDIVTGGDTVDTSTVGTYVVTYDVQDSDGNDAIQKTRTINVTENGGCNDCTNGGDNSPVITVNPEIVYVIVGGTYDILNGVTADDTEDGDITVDIVSTGSVDFNTVGSYVIYYDVQDSDGNDAIQKSRTIYVEKEDNGGGSSSGSIPNRSSSSQGEVLGATTGPGCPHFTEYVRIGATGSEVVKIQEFLNAHMNSGLTVDGVFGKATFKAVNDFQAKYYEDVITPWKLSPNTTGYWYKSTRMMANYIVGCVEQPLLLEDPQVTWSPSNYGQNIKDVFAQEGDLLGNVAGAFASNE